LRAVIKSQRLWQNHPPGGLHGPGGVDLPRRRAALQHLVQPRCEERRRRADARRRPALVLRGVLVIVMPEESAK